MFNYKFAIQLNWTKFAWRQKGKTTNVELKLDSVSMMNTHLVYLKLMDRTRNRDALLTAALIKQKIPT